MAMASLNEPSAMENGHMMNGKGKEVIRHGRTAHNMSSHNEPWAMENGHMMNGKGKEAIRHGRTAHNMSSSSLRKKSDISLVAKVPCGLLRSLLANLQEVILGTKLSVLFPAIALAILAQHYDFDKPWIFGLSLLGLVPLAERVSFLTEQIAYYTGPTVGGLLNATCGNATELIIAVLALRENKVEVVKYSLLGSIISNILLVLGTSLLCGGIANLHKEQKYDKKQADVNILLLLMGLFCHVLPLLFQYAGKSAGLPFIPALQLSRASSIVMLIAYFAYLVFQLWTHRHLFEAPQGPDDDGDDMVCEEAAAIGFWSGIAWLIGMTAFIALLSEYIVETIEDASSSWGISVCFISIILLPIVGNAAEHAGAIIFAFKNKLDISLAVALGSATQISMFVVPFCVIVAWIMGIKMDLNFNILETGSLALSIIITGFVLQEGSSHYMKGLILLLCYVVIAACFFVVKTPLPNQEDVFNLGNLSANNGAFRA
ncbi:Vacuolar cation/proton exchanger 3 [Dionaea muscipula]